MPISADITYPNRAFGLSANEANDGIKVCQTFKNTGATDIASGDVVVLEAGEGGLGVQHTTTADDPLVVGVADEAIAIGETGKVVVWGVKRACNVAAGVAAGELVATSTTAGRAADPVTDVAGTLFGVALTAESSNSATIFVKCM